MHPLRKNQDSASKASLLFLGCCLISTSPLPWLATLWICLLEGREEGTRRGFHALEPRRVQFCLIHSSRSVVSNSLWPHGLQLTRLPWAYSRSLLKLMSIESAMPCNHLPFSSCLQFFPASGSFQMSQLFESGGQSIGVSASASVLPRNIKD